MKLYAAVTSDTGNGQKTRGGNRELTVVLTADTSGGRSEVQVKMVVDIMTGNVELTLDPVTIRPGFRIRR